ncbi:MAG: putative baseplate assembly protein, partial [Bryobacteraceae bacterium]
VGSPCLVIHGPSNLEVFMIGTDGNLYHKNWIGGSWYGPSNLGGGNLVGSPSATAPASKTIEVAAAGSDGNFYHFWFDGSWHGPELVPAGFVPAIPTRKSKAHIQSEQQVFAELPVVDDILAGTTILMLNGLVTGLTAGQAVAVAGTRSDSPNQAIGEVVLLEDIQHVGGFTQLEFQPPGLQNSYSRSSMTLNANTVAATNGATIAVPEVLGSGAASRINQSFTLKRSPIAYVPAATASGAQSTLQVLVNDLIWRQESSLFGLSPTARGYVARQNDDGSTTITFGDGVTGGLLPTGQNNVTATYRVGLGTAGNLPAGSISVLQSRPPGLRSVSNPVPAGGGADPENLASARSNAPRTVLTIDRIVSIADYENFAAAFAGIGKALAIALVMGQTAFIHITVAGVEGAAVDPTSQLLIGLAGAIDAARDPLPPVYISSYQPILFNITAAIIVDETDYVEATVHAQVVNAVTAYFSFDQRSFAQPVTAAEVVA